MVKEVSEDVVLFLNKSFARDDDHYQEEENPPRKQSRMQDEEDPKKRFQEETAETVLGSSSEMVGYVFMALAACCYSTMMLGIRKVVAYDGMQVSQVIFIRGFVQTILSLSVIFNPLAEERWQTALIYPGALSRMVLLRGFLGAAALACYYKAAQYLPLGIVTSIYCTNPVLVLLLAAVMLGEKMSLTEAIATAVSIVGGIFVANPFSTSLSQTDVHNRISGTSLALGAACIGACSYTALRNIATKIRYISSVLSFGVLVLAMGIIMGGSKGLLSFHHQYGKSSLYSAVGASLAGSAAQASMAKGYQYCRAGTGAIIRYIEVPLSYLLAILFLNEKPRIISVLGSVIVLVGIGMVAIEGSRKKRISMTSSSSGNIETTPRHITGK